MSKNFYTTKNPEQGIFENFQDIHTVVCLNTEYAYMTNLGHGLPRWHRRKNLK